jgi:hypothetical protein
MDYLVEFLDTGARVIKDPHLVDKKRHLPNVLLNPKISHLRGISPSFWMRDGEGISVKDFNESKKQVLDSIEDFHSFATEKDLPFSSSSKFFTKISEIDAKHDEKIMNLHTKIMFHHDDIYTKLRELKLESQMKHHLLEAQARTTKKIGMILFLSCALAILLLNVL